MTSAVASVIVASASAVAKVFVIGGIGYVSAIRPRPVPILPGSAMNAISKMNFNLLILPLVYSTLASAVTPDTLGSLWFVVVAGIGVISLSYVVATLLGMLPFFRVDNKDDFDALRVAAAFPNIVALPILIFPTLCEFPVVYDAFYEGSEDSEGVEKYRNCVDQSNATIFVYFFSWNILYWIIGYPTLVAAGERKKCQIMSTIDATSKTEPHLPVDSFRSEDPEDGQDENDQRGLSALHTGAEDGEAEQIEQPASTDESAQSTKCIPHVLRLVANAFIQTMKSPGFIAMVLGIVTACIPPLRDALFSPGGALRFFGSALESLGKASSSVGILMVAASLVHQADDKEDANNTSRRDETRATECAINEMGIPCERTAEPVNQRPNNFRETLRRRRSSISQLSSMAIAAIRHRKPTIRMHSWFMTSRLIVAPALVSSVIIGMECGGVLSGVPNLAKMVVIVNSCLPGAQLIVLTLKSNGLSDSASIIAKVYIPSYLLSVVTIAGWTSLGLMVSLPRDDGTSFCKAV